MKTNNGEGIDAKSGRCRVCGDAAVYMYFGTLACQACKMFFKRYGNNQRKVSACSADGQCEINLNTRHLCTACRLQKCLASGMQVEKIRHSTCFNSTKRKSKEKLLPGRQIHSSSFVDPKMAPYVALDHRPSLTSAQHCLLNNLTHIHDFSNIQTTVHRVNQIEYPKDSPFIWPIHPTVMREFPLCTYQTAAIIWRRNPDFQTLHHLDRSLLLSTSLNNITCLLASHTFARYNLCRNPFLINHLVHLYGSSLLKCHHWTTSFAQLDDPVLFKLFLALFALASVARINRPTVRQEFGDVKAILDIEHRYAEVTWKYLLNKYDHGEAVRRAMKMLRWLLATSVVVYESHQVERHMNEIEGAVEEVEIRLIIEETDKIIDGNM